MGKESHAWIRFSYYRAKPVVFQLKHLKKIHIHTCIHVCTHIYIYIHTHMLYMLLLKLKLIAYTSVNTVTFNAMKIF